MKSPEEEIETFLRPYSPEIRAFAQELRTYLKQETRPSIELAGPSAQSFNIGYGFTTTAWDCFCAIIVYRKHINISLPSGASLPDPDGLLHGTGSRIRHLKIKELKDVQTPAVRKILKEARKKALFLAKDAGFEEDGVQTVIRKRRKK
ncbi:MAG: hypothetical protein HKN82_13900 [Akkermansiaceae bacterium]|nr:hypothetical protein [Akkermansiaceae bacterium]